MKVVVIGTRGIPDIQGGVETHCAGLYPCLADMGVDVTLIRRKNYADALASARGLDSWQGVKLIDVPAPKRKSLEAIVHTFRAVLRARSLKPDILHIHAIGPAIMAPLARLLGMRVVMTNHGPDYDRSKWGGMARRVLRLGERFGSMAANRIIAISPLIASIVSRKYGKECVVIPNGVARPEIPACSDAILASFVLTPRKYILALGRFVPEKGFDRLIDAYASLRASGRIDRAIRLVIAGDADHEDDYSRALRRKAAGVKGVVLTGFISGDTLKALTANAALFAMPSTHEGLPIALLEAMSYGIDVATSDIPSCLLPELLPYDHYPVGSDVALAHLLAAKIDRRATPRAYDMSRYSWPAIARATLDVYRSVAPGS